MKERNKRQSAHSAFDVGRSAFGVVGLCKKNVSVWLDAASQPGERLEPVGGGEGWQILRNGEHVIGLFQGMFERNTLTFNPGWDQQGEETGAFTDVRALQRSLRNAGVEILSEVDERGNGPGSLMVMDPDGNPILIDQHR